MASGIRPAGSYVDIDACSVRTGGSWASVSKIFIRVAGVWEEVWAAFLVTVSGETVGHSVAAPGTATAGVRFNTDGTVDKLEGAAYSQIDSGTDWIIPNGEASAAFYIRATEVSASGTPLTKNGTMNTWEDLGTAREWSAVRAGPSVGTSEWVITIEIAADALGADILSSANYTLQPDLA